MGKFAGQPKVSNAIGRCRHYKHAGLLSVNNVRGHKCLEKKCVYFVPLKDHPYWQDKDKKKSDKKFRKQKQKIEETIKYADAETIAEMIAGFVWKESEDAEL